MFIDIFFELKIYTKKKELRLHRMESRESRLETFFLPVCLCLLLVIYCISVWLSSDIVSWYFFIFIFFLCSLPPHAYSNSSSKFFSVCCASARVLSAHPTGNLRWRHVRELAFKRLLCSDEEYFWHVFRMEHFAQLYSVLASNEMKER